MTDCPIRHLHQVELGRRWSVSPRTLAGHEAMTIGIEQFRAPGEQRLDRMLTQPFRDDASTASRGALT